MPLTYFDSSAFVKLVIEEDGSSTASRLWDECTAAVSSRLAYPEVRAAVAAAGRNHDIDAEGLKEAAHSWEEFWRAVRPVELSQSIERSAGHLAALHGLRGADAVHLASAVAVSDPALIVAAWDRRLRSGAIAERLTVAPVSIDQ